VAILSLRLLSQFYEEQRSLNDVLPTKDTFKNVTLMCKVQLRPYEYQSDEASYYAASLLHLLPEYIPKNISEVKDTLYRTLRNSFAITDRYNDEMGRAVYPSASLFNHSCSPNAWAYFDNLTIRIIALAPIGIGEEICISYLNGTQMDGALRRAELRTSFGFSCKCELCSRVELSPKEANLETSVRECSICEDLLSLPPPLQPAAPIASASSSATPILDETTNSWPTATYTSEREAFMRMETNDLEQLRLSVSSNHPHRIRHLGSILDILFLRFRHARQDEKAIEVGRALTELYRKSGLDLAIPAHYMTHFQCSLSHLCTLSFKGAQRHLELAIQGMKVVGSPLLQESGLLYQLSREPQQFVSFATSLKLLPSLTTAVEDVLVALNDQLTDPKFGLL